MKMTPGGGDYVIYVDFVKYGMEVNAPKSTEGSHNME
jgi:hypothetical protein